MGDKHAVWGCERGTGNGKTQTCQRSILENGACRWSLVSPKIKFPCWVVGVVGV